MKNKRKDKLHKALAGLTKKQLEQTVIAAKKKIEYLQKITK